MAATNRATEVQKDTQDYLTTALFQLLKTHQLENISVTELVKRAGVSRMAFYRNYESINDILVSYFEPIIAQTFDLIRTTAEPDVKQHFLQQFFIDHVAEFKLATDHNFEFIIRNIFNEQMVQFYLESQSNLDIAENKLNYWTKFMSAGVYAMWREWILNPQNMPIEDLHQLLSDFQIATMKTFYQK